MIEALKAIFLITVGIPLGLILGVLIGIIILGVFALLIVSFFYLVISILECFDPKK